MEENGAKLYTVYERLPLSYVSACPVLFEYACANNLHGFDCGRHLIEHLTYADYETKTYPEYIAFPVVFRVFEGTKLSDVISMRFIGMSVLVSDRFVELLQQNNITGWSTYPIRLIGKKGDEISGYQGFTVTGRAGGIIKLVSEKESCFEYNSKYQQWESSSWDGSDFAHIKGRLKTISTEKVQNVLKEAKIKGIFFSPFENEVAII